MRRLAKAIMRFYLGLPSRPFAGLVIRLYDLYRSIKRNRSIITTIDGITYELDFNEMIDSAIYYTGCYEPHTTRAINTLCGEGMTVLDIGANIGCHTLRFAKLVGPKGKVIAFEPMSLPFSKLRRNLELNAFGNVVLEQLALSNENKDDQEVCVSCSWPVSGIDDSQRHPIHRGYMMKEVVSFVTLDDYVKRNGVSKIDLVKLDVDGYEFKVIQGALKTLEFYKPVIIVELGVYTLEEKGDNITELVSLVSGLGYKFYSDRSMKVFPSADIMIDSIPSDGVLNVILSMSDL